MAEHITAGEFERFTERLFKQLDSIEAKQDKTNGRVTALEFNQKNAGKISGRLSAVISVVTTGVIQGALAAFGGKS